MNENQNENLNQASDDTNAQNSQSDNKKSTGTAPKFNDGPYSGPQGNSWQSAGQNYDNYNFQNSNYAQYGGGQPPYEAPKPPKKEHPFLKELGKFSLKVLIGSVIAGVVLVGSLACARGLGIISDPHVSITAPKESGSNSGKPDDGSTNPWGNYRNGYGNRGDGNEDDNSNDQDGNAPGDNNGNNNDGESSESDGPKLGISVQSVPDELTQNGYPEGAMIAKIVSGGNADKAGLKVGDIITSFNGSSVKSADDLVSLVSEVKEGDTVKVVYKRMVDSQLKAMDADVTFASGDSSSSSSSNS